MCAMQQFRTVSYVFAGFLLLAVGCAPSSPARPEVRQAQGSAPTAPSAGRPGGEGSPGQTKESNTAPSGSSLDRLREGASSATSATSPLKDVYFDYDKYDLRADARDVLKANAEWIKNNPGSRIEIEGHCDDRGTNEYNLALGAKRAQSAKEYLVTLGIAPDRLSTISYGAEIPVCKDQTENCWRQNRRARLVVIAGKASS
jgi:peptidoglycan-associated lipoprotein